MTNPLPFPPQPFKQDKYQVKIAAVKETISKNLGSNVLDRVLSYGTRYASQEAERMDLGGLGDSLQKQVALSRLQRFREEHALLEVYDHIKQLLVQGCQFNQIANFLTDERIAEIVKFDSETK